MTHSPERISLIRLNYFNEWMQRVQGKNVHCIPSSVLHQIRMVCKKQNIQCDSLTRDDIVSILKDLHYPIYYDEAQSIVNYLNPSASLSFSPDFENTLRTKFLQIQEPFKQHCSENRRSFLPYYYVLYKLIQLHSTYNDYLKQIPMLQSSIKIKECDLLWKSICKELNWEFIETNP
jgi:hypothetical protein